MRSSSSLPPGQTRGPGGGHQYASSHQQPGGSPGYQHHQHQHAPVQATADVTPTLRVMRLYKPRLNFSPAAPYSTQVDMLRAGRTGVVGSGDSTLNPVLLRQSDFSLASCLILPDSFGNIYRGETFCAYISVLNHLNIPLRQVRVTAKLQAPSAKSVSLFDSRLERGATRSRENPAPVLNRHDNLDMVIQSTLTETGQYTLRVMVEFVDDAASGPVVSPGVPGSGVAGNSVVGGPAASLSQQPPFNPAGANQGAVGAPAATASPRPPQGGPRTLRKFYRFKVEAPVEVHSETRLVNGCAFVQVRLTNSTKGTSLMIADMRFAAADGMRSVDLKHDRSAGKPADALSCVDLFDQKLVLGPGQAQHYLYRVESEPDSAERQPPVEAGAVLGVVQIHWRHCMGESGSHSSPAIVAPPAERSDVQVVLEGMPAMITQGEVFSATATVRNCTEKSIDAQLQWEHLSTGSVLVHGAAFQNIGKIPAGAAVQVPVALLPVHPGLHELDNVVAVDLGTSQQFPQGRLCDVFVHSVSRELGGGASSSAVCDMQADLEPEPDPPLPAIEVPVITPPAAHADLATHHVSEEW